MGDALSSLLFQPPRPTPIKESKLVWLHTKLGSKIPAFFMERPGATITFLYSHANAEDLGTVYPWVKFLAKSLDVNVLAYDYTGYGLSQPNEPSEENCFADIDAAYEYLTTVRRISPANIVLYGRSLGSGPSCYLASRTADEGKSVAGLILHAPFLSVFRVVFESGCTLIGDKFPNVDFAPGIRCPVFIVHGTADRIVPFWHGQKLLQTVPPCCRTRPLFIDGMGHNHVNFNLRPLFAERVKDYLNQYITTGVAAAIQKDGQSDKVPILTEQDLSEITYPAEIESDSDADYEAVIKEYKAMNKSMRTRQRQVVAQQQMGGKTQ